MGSRWRVETRQGSAKFQPIAPYRREVGDSAPIFLRRLYCSACGESRLFELPDTKLSTERQAFHTLKEECPNHG